MTLADFIAADRGPILEAWERRAAERVPRLANADVLRDHLGELLEAIADQLALDNAPDHGDNDSAGQAAKNVEVIAEEHGAGREREGITLEDMVREFPVLRACVVPRWIQSVTACTPDDLTQIVRFDAALDRALTEAVTEFTDRLNHARETFLGILGHDLRNPLSTILAGAQFLRDEHPDATQSRDVVNRIVSTAERMHHLVIDLLDFARTRVTGQMPIESRESDLKATLQDAAGEFSTAHPDRVVNVDVSGDLTGRWDEKRVGQAVGNLLGNALQHGAPDTPIALSACADERQVNIAVHNDGPAISEQDRRTLFQPLRAGNGRRGYGIASNHLGLGLYIARAIAIGHGGSIDVESSADRGTTFTLYLPRRTAKDNSARENWAVSKRSAIA
jgi:signal transduction histidine kinase